MLDYCDKCGWVWQRSIINESNDICGNCEICHNKLKPVPKEYYDEYPYLMSKEMKQKLRQDLVLTSPNFDQYYFDNAINIKGQQGRRFNAAMAHGKAVLEGRDKGNSFGITCPYCKAANVKKITMTSRVISTGLFGFASKKIGKQWHCNHCGSDF